MSKSEFKVINRSLDNFLKTPLQEEPKTKNYLPRLTVVIPSFNQAAYLESCLISLIRQRYGNIELLVCDGGSTDGSVDIIKKYSSHITWWQSKPDGGQAQALNTAFKRATGEYLCWQNSDDMFFPGALEQLVRAARAGNLDLVTGHLYLCDADNEIFSKVMYSPIRRDDIPFVKATITNQCAIFKRSLFNQVGGFNPGLKYCLDLDLWSRMLQVIEKSHVVNEAFGIYRCHDATKTELMVDVHLSERGLITGAILSKKSAFQKIRARLFAAGRKTAYHCKAAHWDYLLEKILVVTKIRANAGWRKR